MRVCTPIKIRYAETDQMGIVYHGNYALYLEDARTHFLEEAGYPYERMEEAGYMSPVVDLSIHYGSPLRYGDTAIVRTRVIENKAAKTVYAYEIFREGMDLDHDTPLATAKSSHCVVGATTFKPVSIKKVMPDLYELYNSLVEPE